MLSKKVLCGVVAYTTLASGSIGSYAAKWIKQKNIPSKIISNPLPIAGALTAVAAAILTYKILTKNYGEDISSENSKDENVNSDELLHQTLPETEKGSEEENKKEEPKGSIENVDTVHKGENNINGQSKELPANSMEKRHVAYLAIGIISAAVIVYLAYKQYKEYLIYQAAFAKLEKAWKGKCGVLKHCRIKFGNEQVNGMTVFRALVDLREDEQGNPVFVFGRKKIELKLSGGKIIEIDKNIYSNKEEQRVYDFNLKDLYYYIDIFDIIYYFDIEKKNIFLPHLVDEQLEEAKNGKIIVEDQELLELVHQLKEYDRQKYENDLKNLRNFCNSISVEIGTKFAACRKVFSAVYFGLRTKLGNIEANFEGEFKLGQKIFDDLLDHELFFEETKSKFNEGKDIDCICEFTSNEVKKAIDLYDRILDDNITAEYIKELRSKELTQDVVKNKNKKMDVFQYLPEAGGDLDSLYGD